MRSRESGYTTIEIAMVLGIMGVLSGMADTVLVMGVEVQNTVKAIYCADYLAGAVRYGTLCCEESAGTPAPPLEDANRAAAAARRLDHRHAWHSRRGALGLRKRRRQQFRRHRGPCPRVQISQLPA